MLCVCVCVDAAGVDMMLCKRRVVHLYAWRCCCFSLILVAHARVVCSLPDRTLLMSELRTDPRLLHYASFHTRKLPALVEKNPLVAVQVLIGMVRTDAFQE